MKKLVVAPQPKSATRDYVVEFPEDVAHLVTVAENGGYEVSSEVAGRLWALYSDGLCASWLSPAGWNDEMVLESLLKHALVANIAIGTPAAPAGYETWLDFAVDTLELPPQAVSTLTNDETVAATSAARDAARTELATLRRLAGRQRP